MVKQIHNLVLARKQKEPFGFRIIGGKDEGLSFKVSKVVIGSPAAEAGMQVGDFLVNVQGKDVFDCDHNTVSNLIRQAGSGLNISIERGDHIVPNFEEIWPSGRKEAEENRRRTNREKGLNYVLNAMEEGMQGHRNEVFTTVGKPKVEVHQYDNPIECYSQDVIEEMSEKGPWKTSLGLSAAGKPGGAAGPSGPMDAAGSKFSPGSSAVLAVLKDQRTGSQQGGHSYGR